MTTREQRNAYARAYYVKHREKCKKAGRDYYKKNKNKILAKANSRIDEIRWIRNEWYRTLSPEKKKKYLDYLKDYREKNRSAINKRRCTPEYRQKARDYYHKNREWVLSKAKAKNDEIRKLRIANGMDIRIRKRTVS